MAATNRKENRRAGHSQKLLSVIGLALCVIFGFMLICNITIIVKGTVAPERPPAVFGVTPMVVLSGSMSGTAEDHIEAGDLIFVGKVDPVELAVGDIIAFMERNSVSVTTHRIIEITEDESGERVYVTKGDANNMEDQVPVTDDRIVGIYKARIPKVGDFALFLQEPLGMILFIGVPLLAFIIYDIIRRQRMASKADAKTSELEAELERLRKLAGEKADEPTAPDE